MYKGNPEHVKYTQAQMRALIDNVFDKYLWILDGYTREEGGNWIDTPMFNTEGYHWHTKYMHSIRFFTNYNHIIEFDEINGLRPWTVNVLSRHGGFNGSDHVGYQPIPGRRESVLNWDARTGTELATVHSRSPLRPFDNEWKLVREGIREGS